MTALFTPTKIADHCQPCGKMTEHEVLNWTETLSSTICLDCSYYEEFEFEQPMEVAM